MHTCHERAQLWSFSGVLLSNFGIFLGGGGGGSCKGWFYLCVVTSYGVFGMLKPFGLCLEYNLFSVSSLQYIQKVPPYVNGMLNTDVCKRLFDGVHFL